jgi:hypothetical protein
MHPVRSALLTLAALLAASSASGQVLGLPVINSGIRTGIGIAGDVGFANSDYPKGTTFGATGILGAGVFGATATVASYDPSANGNNVSSYGGTLNLRVAGVPLAPVSLTFQAGYGYWKIADQGVHHIPIGFGLAFRIPTPVVSLTPWIAPRTDIRSANDTKAKFAVSAGFELGFVFGLGARVTYDWISEGNGQRPGIWGIGAHWMFGL